MKLDLSQMVSPDAPCFGCKQPFAQDEARNVIVYAGSAWKNGQALLYSGAEIFKARVFHDRCNPPEPEGSVAQRGEK